MPLPADWFGTFYSKDTGGDLLFDLEPADYAMLAGEIDPALAFLFAGAYYDLRVNGHAARAATFLAFAKARWPSAPWDKLEAITDAAVAAPNYVTRLNIAQWLVSEAVAELFGGV
jgi:hypothetical protein